MASKALRIGAVVSSVALAAGFVVYRVGGISIWAAEGAGGVPVAAKGETASPEREKALMYGSKSAPIVPSTGTPSTKPASRPAIMAVPTDAKGLPQPTVVKELNAAGQKAGGGQKAIMPSSKSMKLSGQ